MLRRVYSAEIFFRQSKSHQKRRFRGDPEQPIAFAHGLAFARVAARDQSAERRGNSGFFQLQFQRAFFLMRGIQGFLHALNVPLVGLSFIFGVFQLFLRGQAQLPQILLAAVVGVEYLGLGLPIFQIRGDAARFRARRFQVRGHLLIVQPRQNRSGLDAGRRVEKNFGQKAVALGGDFHLMFDDDGTGD